MIIDKSITFRKKQLKNLEPELTAFRNKIIIESGAIDKLRILIYETFVSISWQEDEVRPGIKK